MLAKSGIEDVSKVLQERGEPLWLAGRTLTIRSTTVVHDWSGLMAEVAEYDGRSPLALFWFYPIDEEKQAAVRSLAASCHFPNETAIPWAKEIAPQMVMPFDHRFDRGQDIAYPRLNVADLDHERVQRRKLAQLPVPPDRELHGWLIASDRVRGSASG